MQTTPLTDQLANVSPIWVVSIVLAFTLIRMALAKADQPWARTVSETCDTVNFVLILAFLLVRPFVAQAFYIPSESMEYTLLKHDRLIVDKFSYRLHNPKRHDVVVFNAPPAATDGQEGIDFIKRLVAVPGDTVQVKGAQISIGGEVIDPQQYGLPDVHTYLRSRLGINDNDAVKIFPDYILVANSQRVTKEQIAEQLGQPGAQIVLTPGQTLINGTVAAEPYTREDPGYTYPEDGGALRLGEHEYFMLGDNRNRSRDSHAWGVLERRRIVGHAVVVFWPPARMAKIR